MLDWKQNELRTTQNKHCIWNKWHRREREDYTSAKWRYKRHVIIQQMVVLNMITIIISFTMAIINIYFQSNINLLNLFNVFIEFRYIEFVFLIYWLIYLMTCAKMQSLCWIFWLLQHNVKVSKALLCLFIESLNLLCLTQIMKNCIFH